MDNTNIKNENLEVKEDKQPKTPKQMTLFILRIVGNVLFYSAIVVLFFFSIMNINAGRKNGIPNIFGNGYLRVLTPSMHVEEHNMSNLPEEYSTYKIKQFNCAVTEESEGKTKILYKGDVVSVKMTGKKYFKKFKVGDVVTYWDDDVEIEGKKTGGYVTHRIVFIGKDEAGNASTIYTVGDRKYSEDASVRLDVETLKTSWEKRYTGTEEEKTAARVAIQDIENKYNGSSDLMSLGEGQIKAKVTSVNYKAGYSIYWIQQNWLFIFVIPLAVILAVEIALVVRNIILLRKEKNKGLTAEAQGLDLESEKERMRAELLAELRSQGVIAAETETKAEEASVEEKPTEESTTVEETKEENTEVAATPVVEETVEEPTEAPVEEKTEQEPEAEAPVVEETPAEEAKEEIREETVTEEVKPEETVAEEKEEPVKNDEEASNEPDMSIEENEEEPKVEEKKAPAKKSTTTKKAPAKKSSTTTTKKASTSKKTTKKEEK